MGEQHNLYAYSGNNPTTWGDPSGRAVLAEYGALVGDQADMAEVISSGVGNCANASFGRATASLEGYQLGEDPGQAVLRDCAKGAAKAAAMGAVFSGGGRLVGAGLDAARSGRAISKAADVRTGARALPAGPQPTAAIGPVGNPGAFDSVTPPRFSVDGTGTVTDLHAPNRAPELANPSTINNASEPIRSFVTQNDTVYYRVYSGDSSVGAFLTATPPQTSADAISSLALPPGNQATFIQEVVVPAGTRVQSSIAAEAFGQLGGGRQIQLLEEIPRSSFGPGAQLS